MRSPVTASLIVLSRSAARPDHAGQGVNVTGQQGPPIEGSWPAAPSPTPLFKAPTSPVRGVPAEHRPLHPADLAESTLDIRNGAQCPGRQYVINAGRVHGKLLPVQTDVLDQYRLSATLLSASLRPAVPDRLPGLA